MYLNGNYLEDVMNNNYKVSVEMSREQAMAMIRAMDFFTRIHLGQFQEIEMLNLKDIDGKQIPVDTLRDICDSIKGDLGFRGCYHGVSSKHVEIDAKRCYEIQKTILKEISWKDHPEGGHTVNFDGALKITGEGLPIAKCIDKK